MKWSKTEILRSADKALVLDEEIAFSPATFDGNDRLRKLEKVHVTASGLWGWQPKRTPRPFGSERRDGGSLCDHR